MTKTISKKHIGASRSCEISELKFRNNKIPSFLKPCFWSYDLKSLDLKRNKGLIITQILNYGDMKAIKWLFKTYKEQEIKKVIQSPSRGMWFEKVLNFWVLIFDLKIKEKIKNQAIINIRPYK